LVNSLISALLILFLTKELTYSIFTLIIANLVFYFVFNYNTNSNIIKTKSKKSWLFLAILTLIVGSFYQFISRKTIKSIAEFLIFDFVILGHRIRQNDIILVSTILLIISLVSFYKLYNLRKK
jgi:H+/Cl- antiporter ClcA